MKYLIVLISVLTIAASCSTTKNVAETSPPLPPEVVEPQIEPPVRELPTEHQIVFEDLAKGDSLFASIKRGYCFGTCPVYELNIYNSGFVTYKGVRNVDMLGEYTTQLSNTEMAKFVSLASEIGYMEMKDEYDNPGVTDLPECNTSIVMGGKRKAVKRRYGYPKSILTFEKLFDELLKTQKWDKVIEE